MLQVPVQAEGVRRFVEFALSKILGAAVVEAEDLVVQIQTGGDRGEALSEINAALRVDLEVRVEVQVAKGSLDAEGSGIAIGTNAAPLDLVSILAGVKKVTEDVGAVISHPDPQRKSSAIIGWTYVKGVGSLAQQRGAVDAQPRVHIICPRSGIAVISRDAQSAQETWEVAEMLLEGQLEACNISAAGVRGLVHKAGWGGAAWARS